MKEDDVAAAIRDLRGAMYAQRVFRVSLMSALPAAASRTMSVEMQHHADVVRAAELRAERQHATLIESFEREIQSEIALLERLTAAKTPPAPGRS